MGLLRKKQQPIARRRFSGQSASDDREHSTATFRRNRTLTGSLSPNVGSAGESSSELRSARVQHHDLRAHRRRLGVHLLISLLAAGALVWALYQFVVSVHIVANTPVVVDKVYYEKQIQDYLNANMWQRFRSTIDVEALTHYMQTHGSPEILGVKSDTDPDGFAAIRITLNIREPAVSWRAGATVLYVDDQGYAFKRNYYAEPEVTVVDQTGIQAVNNQVLASERFLSMIGKVIGRMKAEGYTVTQVVLPADTTRQLLISAMGVGYPIKFSVDRPAGEQSEDAARAIRHLSKRGTKPKYLDVRVGGKAFYK